MLLGNVFLFALNCCGTRPFSQSFSEARGKQWGMGSGDIVLRSSQSGLVVSTSYSKLVGERLPNSNGTAEKKVIIAF